MYVHFLLRIENVINKVRINRKCPRSIISTERGENTIDTDFLNNFFDSEEKVDIHYSFKIINVFNLDKNCEFSMYQIPVIMTYWFIVLS